MSDTTTFRWSATVARLSLAAACLGFLATSACTRPTVGFCNASIECNEGSFCALPDHECQQALFIRGEFTGGQVVPPTASIAVGSIIMKVSNDRSSIDYEITSSGPGMPSLPPVINSVELRQGRYGMSGSLLRSLGTEPKGSMPLDPDTLRAFKAGEIFAQIATPDFPNGELRAQLFSTDPADLSAGPTVALSGALSGLVASPADNSPATGIVSMQYSEAAGTITYSFQYAGITTPITGLHIHRGGFNINGPHLADLPLDMNTTVRGTVDKSAIINVYPEQKHIYSVLLKSGVTYLNIHTTQFSKGEIRGQLLPSEAVPFNVQLKQPGIQDSQGDGQFYLSADRRKLSFRLSHAVQAPTGAHLIRGMPPTMGALVPLTCPELSNKSRGLDKAMGYCDVVPPGGAASDISTDDLRNKNVYIVITTADAPNGKVVGQLVVPGL